MADGFLSSLGRRAAEARDAAEDYGHAAKRRLHDRADDAREAAGDYGRGASRRLRDRGEDARGELRRLWSQLEDVVDRHVTPVASDAARAAGNYARDGRDVALDMADHLRSATRARPLMVIGIAVAATWIVASLLGGRRQ